MKGSNIYWGLALSGAVLTATLWQTKLNKNAEKISEITPLADRISLFSNPEPMSSGNEIKFLDETFLLGLNHRHMQKKDKISSFEDSLGAGVCVADFNNDGWDDLFFVTGSGNRRHFGSDIWWQDSLPNQFYMNKGGNYFVNITNDAAIKKSFFGIACAASDLNDDGLVDIVVANKGGNIIYENLGQAKFKLHEQAFAEDPKLFSTSILIRDYNQDGKKDILFGNYVTFTQEQNVLELNAGFNTQKNTNFDPALYDAQPDILFISQGDLKFIENKSYIEPNKHGRSLGFYMENNSILVLNDKGSPSQTTSITDENPQLKSIVINARDAERVSSPANNQKSLLLASDAIRGGVYAFSFVGNILNDESWDYGINDEHRLHANTWSILPSDFNLDGTEDLYLANGSLMPHPDTVQTPTGQRSFLLSANKKTGKFVEQRQNNMRNLSARGGATFDLNLDGKIDIVIANNNDYPSLLVNQSPINSPWLGLKCIPINQCMNVDISVNDSTFTNPFKIKQAFASQSGNQFLMPLTTDNDATVKILRDNKVLFSFTGKNHYFLLDLTQKNARELTHSKLNGTQDQSANIEEYIYLLSEQNRSPRAVELENLLVSVPDEQKLLLLDAMNLYKNRLYFQLADVWATAKNKTVSLASIGVLETLELEQSIPTLMNLVSASDINISCKAITAFQFFYWKDEAATERKNWGESPIIQALDSSDKQKVACAIDALAESESYRALSPLTNRLRGDDDYIAMKAARALGMLRQTEVAKDLKFALLNHVSPFVRAEALVALSRLDTDLTDIDLQDVKKPKDSLFNAALVSTLENSDDGVVINSLIPTLLNDKIDSSFTLFKYLSTDQLYVVYNKIADRSKNSGKSPILLAQDIFDIIQLEEFSDLQNPRNIPLIANLEDSQKFQIVEQLPIKKFVQIVMNNPILAENLCKYRDAHVSNNRCELLKNARSTKPEQISTELRQALNSGKYEEAQLLSVMYAKLPGYSFAINQLINDNRLQLTERQFVLTNFVMNVENLQTITNYLKDIEEKDQLKILRNIQDNIPRSSFSSWLASYAKASNMDSIKFYAARFEDKSQKESI